MPEITRSDRARTFMCIMYVCLDVCLCAFFWGRSSVVFISFSEKTMTHKRLRTTLGQPPPIRGKEIESREENDCLRSHCQDWSPGLSIPSPAGWFPEFGSSPCSRQNPRYCSHSLLSGLEQLDRLDAFHGSGQLGTHFQTFLFPDSLAGGDSSAIF